MIQCPEQDQHHHNTTNNKHDIRAARVHTRKDDGANNVKDFKQNCAETVATRKRKRQRNHDRSEKCGDSHQNK